MSDESRGRSALWWLSRAAAVGAAAYGAYAAVTWLRYGHPSKPAADAHDPLLDTFMPAYDIVERHHIRVRAPADVTFAAACETDLFGTPISRAIFKGREWLLGAESASSPRPRGVIAMATSIGWGVLAEVPGREIVMGAVTRPWEANVVFRRVPADDFAAFSDSDSVKIAWTLRADPLSADASVFRTETRVIALDAGARRKFRRYWSLLSPGIIAIRWIMLGPLKREAERRHWRHAYLGENSAVMRKNSGYGFD